jgi:hypothetical protein
MKTTEFTGIRVEVETNLSFDEVTQRLQRSTGQATVQDMIRAPARSRTATSTTASSTTSTRRPAGSSYSRR